MSATSVALREKTIWVVEVDCSGETKSWRFDDEDVAEWFRDVVRDYYLSRCPACGIKDMLDMEVGVRDFTGAAMVIVWCSFHDCDFAKRIVRTERVSENFPWLDRK